MPVHVPAPVAASAPTPMTRPTAVPPKPPQVRPAEPPAVVVPRCTRGGCRICGADPVSGAPLFPAAIAELVDFEPSPEIDDCLDALVHRSKYDPLARNALYGALSFKIVRFVRHAQWRQAHLIICEPADIAQQAYVVFAEVVRQWPEQDHFSGYFFSRFPWRLARAIAQIERGRSAVAAQSLDDLDEDERARVAGPDPRSNDDELLLGFDERDRLLLTLRVDYGFTWAEIGRILGLPRRTVLRARARIAEQLRQELPGAGAARVRGCEGKPSREARRSPELS